MLGGSGKQWTDRQWLVLDGLEVIFRSSECISRGSDQWTLTSGRVNNSDVAAMSGEICWWPGLRSDSGGGAVEVVEREN